MHKRNAKIFTNVVVLNMLNQLTQRRKGHTAFLELTTVCGEESHDPCCPAP